MPATKQWGPTNYFESGGKEGYSSRWGLACLLFGWIEFGDLRKGQFGFLAWLANPLALITLIFFFCRLSKTAAFLGACTTFLASVYLFAPVGPPLHPDQPQSGAWIWVWSFFVLTFAAVVQSIIPKPQKPKYDARLSNYRRFPV